MPLLKCSKSNYCRNRLWYLISYLKKYFDSFSFGKKMSDCNLESSVFVRKLGGDAPNYTY